MTALIINGTCVMCLPFWSLSILAFYGTKKQNFGIIFELSLLSCSSFFSVSAFWDLFSHLSPLPLLPFAVEAVKAICQNVNHLK